MHIAIKMVEENKGIKLKIPEGVTVQIDGSLVKAIGPKGTLEKDLFHPWLEMRVEGDNIVIRTKRAKETRVDNLLMHTYRAHVRNILTGVKSGYVAKLKICSGHFPMNVGIDGDQITIKNFFGEKIPRKAKIMKGAVVKIDGDLIVVTGLDKDIVGQTAGRIEQATTIRSRDRRRFQDGCHVIAPTSENEQ